MSKNNKSKARERRDAARMNEHIIVLAGGLLPPAEAEGARLALTLSSNICPRLPSTALNGRSENPSPAPSTGHPPAESIEPPEKAQWVSNCLLNPNLIPLGTRRRRTSVASPNPIDTPTNEAEEAQEQAFSESVPVPENLSPMAPAMPLTPKEDPPGPHPSFIEIAKPYVFQQQIQQCMAIIHMNEVPEETVRLQGVNWIDQVRKYLQLLVFLPV